MHNTVGEIEGSTWIPPISVIIYTLSLVLGMDWSHHLNHVDCQRSLLLPVHAPHHSQKMEPKMMVSTVSM